MESLDGEGVGGGSDGDVGAGATEDVDDDDGFHGLGAVGDGNEDVMRSGHECG